MSGAIEDLRLRLSDGRTLGYAQYGVPDGKPLFVFHGSPGSRLQVRAAHAPALARGIRIIAPDRPGLGLSTRLPGRQVADWPSDVRELADALNIARFAVIGVSGGGPYVAACAWGLPERITRAGIVSGVAPPAPGSAPRQRPATPSARRARSGPQDALAAARRHDHGRDAVTPLDGAPLRGRTRVGVAGGLRHPGASRDRRLSDGRHEGGVPPRRAGRGRGASVADTALDVSPGGHPGPGAPVARGRRRRGAGRHGPLSR